MKSILIKDRIMWGQITYSPGDEVVVYKRKQNGHPRALKDGVSYFIKSVQTDGHLEVREKSGDGNGWMQPIKVHKMYVINRGILRDIKLNYLFDETN
jgi:hypothetical protein